jgi:hypothetical protein
MTNYGKSLVLRNHVDPPPDAIVTSNKMTEKTEPSPLSSSTSSAPNSTLKQKALITSSSSSSNPPDYLDPFFGPPPSWGLFSHDPRVQSSNSEDTLNLELYLTSERLVKVEILSSLQDTNFFLPLSLLIERELSMRQCAEDYHLKSDRWSGSLLYREWRNAIDDVSSTPDDRAFQQANGDVSIYLTPEADCALSNHSQSLVWTEALTTCIRAYYNTGTVRFPNDCVGSDVLLALEYFGIVYTPHQLVFDSFGVYLRVKLWSEYFTYRSKLAQWVVETLMTSHSKHTHVFVTSPLEQEGDLLLGSHRVTRFEGNLKLDSRKYATTRSHAVVHDFFNGDEEALTPEDVVKVMGDKDGTKGDSSQPSTSTSIPLDVLMRDDFAQYLSYSLPGTTVTFQCKHVQHVSTGRVLKRATLQISFLDSRIPSILKTTSQQNNIGTRPPLTTEKPLDPQSKSRISPTTKDVDKPTTITQTVKSRSSSPNPAAVFIGKVSSSLSRRRNNSVSKTPPPIHITRSTSPSKAIPTKTAAATTTTATMTTATLTSVNMSKGQSQITAVSASSNVSPRMSKHTDENDVHQKNSASILHPMNTVNSAKGDNKRNNHSTLPTKKIVMSTSDLSTKEVRNPKTTRNISSQSKLSNPINNNFSNSSQPKHVSDKNPKDLKLNNSTDNTQSWSQKATTRVSSPHKYNMSTNCSSHAPTDESMNQPYHNSVAPSDEQNPYAQDHRAPVKTIWEGDLATVISAITSPFRDDDVVSSRKLLTQSSSSKQKLSNNHVHKSSATTTRPNAKSNHHQKEQQQQRQSHQHQRQGNPKATKNMPRKFTESTMSSNIPVPSTVDDDRTDARTDWNMSSVASDRSSRLDPSLQRFGNGTMECGGEDIFSSAFHFMFGTGSQSETTQTTAKALTFPNNIPHPCPNGCHIDATPDGDPTTAATTTRVSSAMSTMEQFLPDIDLQARDDVERQIPDATSVTLEDTAAKWLRRAINFNQLIFDDPIVDNDDDEYLRLVRQTEHSQNMGIPKWNTKTQDQCQAQQNLSCNSHPVLPKVQCNYYQDTTQPSNTFTCAQDVTGNFKNCTHQTMATPGTSMRDMFDSILMTDNNSMNVGSIASTEGSSANSAFGSNSSPSTTQLKKAGPFIPLESDSSLESIEQAYLEKRNIAGINATKPPTMQAQDVNPSEFEKLDVLTYPNSHRRSRFGTPHPGALAKQQEQQQQQEQVNDTWNPPHLSSKKEPYDKVLAVRVPPWIGVKKRGKYRGDVTTETAQTAKIHNGEQHAQKSSTMTLPPADDEKHGMDATKSSSSSRLAGLFRSRGLVRRSSLGEMKVKE